MIKGSEIKRYAVDITGLPALFPTQRHPSAFWEALGRAVATFGFLEETLGKAIFSFSATRRVPEEDIEAEFDRWLPTLKRALSDPLGKLTDAYEKAVLKNPDATIINLNELLDDLRRASVVRNVLCHASWRTPDAGGRSQPFFVNSKSEVFDGLVDIAYLHQLQRHVAALAGAVISTVTHMGWQFPGSSGPGTPIWAAESGTPPEQ